MVNSSLLRAIQAVGIGGSRYGSQKTTDCRMHGRVFKTRFPLTSDAYMAMLSVSVARSSVLRHRKSINCVLLNSYMSFDIFVKMTQHPSYLSQRRKFQAHKLRHNCGSLQRISGRSSHLCSPWRVRALHALSQSKSVRYIARIGNSAPARPRLATATSPTYPCHLL
jgi:hypothetical protein